MDPTAALSPTQVIIFAWASFATHATIIVVAVKLLWEVRRLQHRFTIVWNWFKREHGIDDSEG